MPIYKLDAATSEKIAAGEVIENPASVVKELLENSLDAGAKHIKVILKKGGLQEITVIDDGSGILADELRLAVERHATSKIKRFQDLERISSLGFRGEALPSIASVSKMSIISRHKKENIGSRIVLEGNKEKKLEEVGFPVGTSVTVTDLFYNTPARLKFLKGVPAETARVTRIVHLLALSRPDVSFSLLKESGPLLETSGDGRLFNVIVNLYGTSLARELIPLDFQGEEIALKGYISNPSFSRNSRIFQVFFVNNRFVRNQLMKGILDNSFSRIVTSRKYPAAFLFLSVDPENIDVNVHPSKTEIRFNREEMVQKYLEECLRQAFSPYYFIPRVQKNNKLQPEMEEKKIPLKGIKRETVKAGISEEIERDEALQPNNNLYQERIKESGNQRNYDSFQDFDTGKTPKAPKLAARLFTGKPLPGTIKGQIFGTYILLEEEEGLILIDQHAAHERILWEEIERNEKSREHYLQEIIPFPLEVPSFMVEELTDKVHLLREIGLEMEQFGNNTFIIRAVPFFLKDVFSADMIFSILENCSGLALTGREYQKQTLLKIACKTAVKANRVFTVEEIRNLLVQLGQCKNPYYCPHGSPVMIKLEKDEIGKYFKRQG